ncbi:hypothetical protein [Lactiplantibacillus pentosus]|uniref:hypothetical protein n=1 Tax=Lactiplantibacillus pentosus TaxID=1589 RepID=UPI001CDD04E3|nr:hypothetical protein [Lactiplantibacillus pentosus]MDT6967321.1 hypothetical protein [Lactiplantibacillus pentosus]MDT7000889.1 hypothetical protein [Lactiplantibacillus pentosus]
MEIIATIAAFGVMLTMHFHYQPRNQQIAPQSHHDQLKSFRLGITYMQSRTMIKLTILLSVILNFFYTAVTIGRLIFSKPNCIPATAPWVFSRLVVPLECYSAA